jgi:NhaP-type Na+/H+ or K+/H+ antiporter
MKKIFVTVTIAALAGMVMGGLFGLASAKLTPDFFRHIVPWSDVEPVGFATFAGAVAGVLLGGALGCFGIIVQSISERKKR